LTHSYFLQNPECPKRKLPPPNNYSELTPLPPTTRKSVEENCNCQICKIARMKIAEYKLFTKQHKNNLGAPKTTPSSPPRAPKICTKCLTDLRPGKPHKCTKTQFKINMTGFFKKKSPSSKSLIAANILKNTSGENSFRGSVLELKSGSNTLPVYIGTPKVAPKKPKFSHDALIRLQTAINLSDRAIK